MAYKILTVGERYLKNLDPLASSPQQGITQSDVNAAQAEADTLIVLALGGVYDVSGWAASPPPIIASIADRLGSAYLIRCKFSRDGKADPRFGDFLADEAKELLGLLRDGAPLRGADGAVQRPKNTMGPRAR